MNLGLDGSVFLVTGGSRGLGRASASALLSEGARVVLASRAPDDLDDAARALGCASVAGDLADPEAATRFVAGCLETYGRLDGALISVGGPPAGDSLTLTDEEWSAAFASVFLGAVRLCRAVVRALPESGGSLALVLSTSVKTPIPGLAASNGLRPGLAMLAKTMADELGPRGVRVNALLPGRVDTARLRELDGGDPGRRTAQEASIPLRRYGQPEEFGRVAAFLLSPAASYITGAMIPVDGGVLRAL
jgi:3-oxoacyl-[acyl-carrier protein] reductase